MKFLRNFLIIFFILINFAIANNSKVLNKVDKYMFNMNTFQADFLQFSNNGDSSEGKFYLSRPDKLKFEYINPFKSTLVTNGKTTKYYDIELDELTTIPTKRTPLLFLLNKKKSIKELGFDIISIEDRNNKIYVRTSNKKIKELEEKYIIFVFDSDIKNLIGINIEDELKNQLYIEFNNIKLNNIVDKNIFNLDLKNRNKKGKF